MELAETRDKLKFLLWGARNAVEKKTASEDFVDCVYAPWERDRSIQLYHCAYVGRLTCVDQLSGEQVNTAKRIEERQYEEVTKIIGPLCFVPPLLDKGVAV